MYYLRSRYFDSAISRFLNADCVISKNLFAYCSNNSIKCIDISGYNDTNVLIMYDARPNRTQEHDEYRGLRSQGLWAVKEYVKAGCKVDTKPFYNISGFVSAWNSIEPDKYDIVLIYVHGSPGTLDCNGEFLRNESGTESYIVKSSKEEYRCYPAGCLKTTRVGKIGLFSCNGATPNSRGRSAAEMISAKASGASRCRFIRINLAEY